MLNQVNLIGRLGRDPETRYMSNNEPVCNFSVATSEKWKDKDGNAQEKTEWHNIVVYRKLAEICQQYLKKGDLVFLKGKIVSRKYTGNDGVERTAYDIVCDDMKMLGSKNDNGYNPFPTEQHSNLGVAKTPPKPPTGNNPPPTQGDDLGEDDIPF